MEPRSLTLHRPMLKCVCPLLLYVMLKNLAILEKWVPYSQRYLVLGLVGLVGLVD